MPPRPRPELAHGDVVGAEALLGVNRHSVRAAALRMRLQPARLRQRGQHSVMVVGDAVGTRPAEIVEETIARRATVDDAAGDDGEKRDQVVAAAPPELLAERRRPVGDLDLPAVRVQVLQRRAGERSRPRAMTKKRSEPRLVNGTVLSIPSDRFTFVELTWPRSSRGPSWLL